MGSNRTQSTGLPTRILLAEDNDAMLVEEALRSRAIDYELVRVRDGRAALEYVAALECESVLPAPHVFVLDLHLPMHNGLEIIQEIRAGLRCGELPIIALSASESPGEIEGVRSHSAIYFRKLSDFDAYMKLGTVVLDAMRNQPRERILNGA